MYILKEHSLNFKAIHKADMQYHFNPWKKAKFTLKIGLNPKLHKCT